MGRPCCRLPIPLDICPCCGGGIKQTRGWTWVNPIPLFGGEVYKPACSMCPAGNPALIGDRAGLLWIGERFYKSPADFDREAVSMGISRRIATVPHGFKLGETFILLAHPKAVRVKVPADKGDQLFPGVEYKPGIFRIFRPTRIEKILTKAMATKDELASLERRGITPVIVPDADPDHQGSVYDGEDE